MQHNSFKHISLFCVSQQKDFIEKGFKNPIVTFIVTDTDLQLHMRSGYYGDVGYFSKTVFGEDWPSILTSANDAIREIGSIADHKKAKLLEQIADAMKNAEEIGLDDTEIEAHVLNPLRDMMKSLSENIITHKK